MSGYVTIFRTVYCATNAHVLLLKIQSVLKIIDYPISSREYIKMAVRVHFEGNNEVGVFSALTNAYCLVAIGGSQNFYR